MSFDATKQSHISLPSFLKTQQIKFPRAKESFHQENKTPTYSQDAEQIFSPPSPTTHPTS
jgi:hypothetical protein